MFKAKQEHSIEERTVTKTGLFGRLPVQGIELRKSWLITTYFDSKMNETHNVDVVSLRYSTKLTQVIQNCKLYFFLFGQSWSELGKEA